MKTKCIIFLLAICAWSQLTTANNVAERHNVENFQLPSTETVKAGSLNIKILPQIELISIIQHISDYKKNLPFLMNPDTNSYSTDVSEHFTPYNYHEAVRMFNRLSMKPGGLNFNAPSFIMLYFDNNLELRTDINPEQFVVNRIGGFDSLKLFAVLLEDFARISHFNEFFKAHSGIYVTMLNEVKSDMGSVNYIEEVEKIFGKKQKSYNIVLAPLYGRVGFGNYLYLKTSESEIYTVLGCRGMKDGHPFFGNEAYLKPMIRHELCHPFVNPLTEKNWDLIKDYSANYNSIPEQARKNVCGDWQECINEFTIRSITVFLAKKENEDYGLQIHNKEYSRGVSYLDKLLEKIEIYDKNRNQYPDFNSYFHEILKTFMAVSENGTIK